MHNLVIFQYFFVIFCLFLAHDNDDFLLLWLQLTWSVVGDLQSSTAAVRLCDNPSNPCGRSRNCDFDFGDLGAREYGSIEPGEQRSPIHHSA